MFTRNPALSDLPANGWISYYKLICYKFRNVHFTIILTIFSATQLVNHPTGFPWDYSWLIFHLCVRKIVKVISNYPQALSFFLNSNPSFKFFFFSQTFSFKSSSINYPFGINDPWVWLILKILALQQWLQGQDFHMRSFSPLWESSTPPPVP